MKEISKSIPFQPRPLESDPLPAELVTRTATDATRKAYTVQVDRTPEIQDSRLKLPVVAEEQKIMEAIHNHDTVVVWGATGSGKTTQVPQFLYEAGYGDKNGPTPGMIGVTQPRRVAAVSMAERVGDELGSTKKNVAYQIRFERSGREDETAIKFMTDGILLREIAQDFALTKYSAIVIDEAHERSVNTDILIGLLSRIVNLRVEMAKEDKKAKPLKLVIMSATLRISDFTQNGRLFKNVPPLVKAEGRQYPVTMHFSRRTRHDYVEEAFQKVSKGHRKLPHGGMLVFLTGQNEITTLAKRLKQAFKSTQGADTKQPNVRISAAEAPLDVEDVDLGGHADIANDDEDSSEYEIHGLSDDEDDKEFDIAEGGEGVGDLMNVHVLPLYSQLPTSQQLRVFQAVPGNSRLIVLATNVAETSLTIPGIRYVFDCGRAKEKKYDKTTGVQSFEVGWISKASANQRAGRAGRTSPGHCYRLYSSAVFERDFEEYAEPEILRTPIEGLVLQLKSMDLHQVVNFPFPTPPNREALRNAERLLTYLGALDADSKVTKLGRELSIYPLSPRLSRMLIIGQNYNLSYYTVALVAALAVPDLIIPENQMDLVSRKPQEGELWTQADNAEEAARDARRKSYHQALGKLSSLSRTSDALKLLQALREHVADPTEEKCHSLYLRPKALKEADQLRIQLVGLINSNKPGAVLSTHRSMPTPKKQEREILKQIIAAGFIDQVAVHADLHPAPPPALLERKPKRAIDTPYLTLFPSAHITRDSENPELEQAVYLHPSSVLARTDPKKLPQYLVYSHLQRSSQALPGKLPKTRMHALTPVTGAQLSILAKGTPLIEYSTSKGKTEELDPAEGCQRRKCWVIPELRGEKGKGGWPLPMKQVVQRRVLGKGWMLEKEVQ